MCRNYNVCLLPGVVAAIFGIIIGVLFFLGTIAVEIIGTPIIISLIFAAVTLILLYVTAAFGEKKQLQECVCGYGRCLIFSGILALAASFIALILIDSLVAGSIGFAILIGIGGFAAILNFFSFVGLLSCIIERNCYKTNSQCCKSEKDYFE